MSKKLATALLLVSFNVLANETPKNYMLFMGAGSEPKDKSTTIFDEEAGNVGKFVSKNKDWNTPISFNGGHATTENEFSKICRAK